MSDFTTRINAATDTDNPAEYINRVKSVVADEITRNDQSVKLVDTGYYSNSVIPDFEAIWDKNNIKRPIFLRHGLEDVIAAQDTEFIPADEPAILTLDTIEPDTKTVNEAESLVKLKPNTLITTATSFDSDIFEDSLDSRTFPLKNIIRNNFFKSARGLITPKTIESFTYVKTDDTRQLINSQKISSYFDEKIAFRINALEKLLQLSSMESLEITKSIDTLDLLGGSLTLQELEWILPTLLQSKNPLPNKLWKNLGSLFNLGDLEKISTALENLNLTDLVESNISSWSARRAYSTILISDEDDVEYKTSGEYWEFKGTVLNKFLPESSRRIAIAQDPKKLKKKNSETSRNWDQIEDSLSGHTLLEVSLKGIKRSVSINSLQSSDIRKDVNDITESVEDKYLIDSVTLGLMNLEDELTRVDVHIGDSLLTAESDIKIVELLNAATSIFSYKKIID